MDLGDASCLDGGKDSRGWREGVKRVHIVVQLGSQAWMNVVPGVNNECGSRHLLSLTCHHPWRTQARQSSKSSCCWWWFRRIRTLPCCCFHVLLVFFLSRSLSHPPSRQAKKRDRSRAHAYNPQTASKDMFSLEAKFPAPCRDHRCWGRLSASCVPLLVLLY